jgi:hypothetical protein
MTKQIGIRLSDSNFAELAKRAEQNKTTPADMLRQIFVEHIEAGEQADQHAKTLTAVQEAHRANLAAFADLLGGLSKSQAIERAFRDQVRAALKIQPPAATTAQPAPAATK